MKLRVASLKKHVKVALKALGYTKREIDVELSDKYSMYYPGDDGCRGVFQLVGARPSAVIRGAFGGAALGAREQSPVDSDRTRRELPEKTVAILGQEGGFVELSITARSYSDVM